MKVPLLQQIISDFIEYQIQRPLTDWYYPHSLVSRFHQEWQKLAERGLKETYDQCLRSEISNRWWKRENYRPKEIMLQLIDADPELASIAWKDLQQPNASLDGRLSRFEYYCEQLLDLHRQQHIRAIETYHHQDASILSLYLAGLFPETYTLYPGLISFQQFCRAVGSPDIPKVDDLVRYMKVAGIVFSFLRKNEQWELMLEKRTDEVPSISCIPFQVAFEVISFAADNFQSLPK